MMFCVMSLLVIMMSHADECPEVFATLPWIPVCDAKEDDDEQVVIKFLSDVLQDKCVLKSDNADEQKAFDNEIAECKQLLERDGLAIQQGSQYTLTLKAQYNTCVLEYGYILSGFDHVVDSLGDAYRDSDPEFVKRLIKIIQDRQKRGGGDHSRDPSNLPLPGSMDALIEENEKLHSMITYLNSYAGKLEESNKQLYEKWKYCCDEVIRLKLRLDHTIRERAAG